jgi:hypothetical protein
MTRQSEKIRYSSWNFIQDIIGFIFNYFFSFSDPGQDHIAETYDNHIQPDEPQNIKPILQLMYILMHLLKFQIDTSLLSYLLYSMISLQIITNIFLGLMENMVTSLLNNTFMVLKNFLTFLRLKKMMSVSGFFIYLCKVKLMNGSKICQLQTFVISINL